MSDFPTIGPSDDPDATPATPPPLPGTPPPLPSQQPAPPQASPPQGPAQPAYPQQPQPYPQSAPSYPQAPPAQPAPPPGQWGPPAAAPVGWGPPGYVPPGQPAYAAAPYGAYAPRQAQRIEGLGLACTILLSIVAFICVVAAVLALIARSAAQDLLDGNRRAFEAFEQFDNAGAGFSFYLLGVLVTGIVWLIWQFRYVSNASIRGPVPLAAGWAIGGWFLPFANFIIPQLQVVQATRATLADPAQPHVRPKIPPIVIVWWALWVVATIVFWIGAGLEPSDTELFSNDLENYITAFTIEAIGMFMLAGAAVVAAVMVRSLSRTQSRVFGIGTNPAAATYAYPQYPS